MLGMISLIIVCKNNYEWFIWAVCNEVLGLFVDFCYGFKKKSFSPIIRRDYNNIISSGRYKLLLLEFRTWFYQKSACNFVC